MQTTAGPLVQETLPLAAQYGILGLLCLGFAISTGYLVWKLDSVRELHARQSRAEAEAHAKQLRDQAETHARAIADLQAERVRDTAEYAQALVELLQPVQHVVAQVEAIAKVFADRAEKADRRRRGADER